MILEWIPLKSVGQFVFGTPIDEYYKKFSLKPIPEEYYEGVGWEVFGISGEDLRLYFEKGRLKAVLCKESCLYRGMNLIGMAIEEVTDMLNEEPDIMEPEELSDGWQEVYDFENLGLQLWVKKGTVVTAICSDICSDEENGE
ncbi:MAG: hypothetical protein GY795_33405 [Desulfobacterales bacterium]|nr:hypothetical protein [Desulfobacterales bacterium]